MEFHGGKIYLAVEFVPAIGIKKMNDVVLRNPSVPLVRSLAPVIVLAAITTIVVACSSSTGPELQGSRAILFGQVTDTEDSPLVGAEVAMTHHVDACSSEPVERDVAPTSAGGRYRASFVILSSAGGCVKLRFTAPGFEPDSVVRTDVRFVTGALPDSFETNIRLRRR